MQLMGITRKLFGGVDLRFRVCIEFGFVLRVFCFYESTSFISHETEPCWSSL